MSVGGKGRMGQPTFAELENQGRKRKTRREMLLERMDDLIHQRRLEERIAPSIPRSAGPAATTRWS